MNSCLIPSSAYEHYLDLHISPNLIKDLLKEGYTHIHFGAVKIVLATHGRYKLPTTIKLALLNSTFLRYELTIIGTQTSKPSGDGDASCH